MVDELVTESPRVEAVGSFVYLILTSGDDETTYVLKRSDAQRLAGDLEAVVASLNHE